MPWGGTGRGSPTVRQFGVTFNTPNILTGSQLYLPNVGDEILDISVEVDTAWNGTTPLLDVGTFLGNTAGLFKKAGNALNVLNAAGQTAGSGILIAGAGMWSLAQLSGFLGNFSVVPAKVVAANPLLVVVSQTGANNGLSPGATQGAATIYITTATPV